MTNAEIQIGEYVRTNNARGIKKVARINEKATANRYLFIDGYDHSDTIYGIIRTDQITNHSFNIKDLIEVGDFINGWKVLDIWDEDDKTFLTSSGDGYISKIYSVVTKEQFKAMEYKVGEEK